MICNLDFPNNGDIGNEGFFCFGCPKIYQKGISPSPSQIPPVSVTLLPPRNHIPGEDQDVSLGGVVVRKLDIPCECIIYVMGPYTHIQKTPVVRRQQNANLGASFDGAFGVDSEDILNIPEIGFGSFQLFSDQENYGPLDFTLPPLLTNHHGTTFQVRVLEIKQDHEHNTPQLNICSQNRQAYCSLGLWTTNTGQYPSICSIWL